MHRSITNYLDRLDQVARQVAKAIVEKFGVKSRVLDEAIRS
jgi:hypothetical protein